MSLWNKIWSLNVPSKAKHLLWRMSEDLLPRSEIICDETIARDDVCFSCDKIDGDYTHTLIRCEYARVVWFGCSLGLKVDKIPIITLSELATILCKGLDKDIVALWAMVAWGIWYNRHTRRCYDPIDLIEKMVRELEEFQNRNSYVKLPNKKAFQKGNWVAPLIGWVKINFSLCRFSSNDFGIGCVIRDDMGYVLGSFVKRITSEKKAIETTFYESLKFGLSMGFRSIILETHHQGRVQKLQSKKRKISKKVEDNQDIITIPPKDYNLFVFHISRDDNHLARSIARIAGEIDKCNVWIDELPPGVTNTNMI